MEGVFLELIHSCSRLFFVSFRKLAKHTFFTLTHTRLPKLDTVQRLNLVLLYILARPICSFTPIYLSEIFCIVHIIIFIYISMADECRKGPWTLEEDTLLSQYISTHGEGRWNLLAKRSGKSFYIIKIEYIFIYI